ncbi:GNAT family N-acetyltransferase [Methylobacterium sp.]|uniref:GNAT family N-acetyltransferase n=1 Tax=Methylobacterium sp. TaxID=409 RepID=UPI003C7180DF
MSEFPFIFTRRLSLREPSLGDVEEFHKLLSLWEVSRFSNWPDDPTPVQSERAVKRMCRSFAKGTGCAWIIEERASRSLLGAIRFNNIDKYCRWAEIGYELHPSHWGLGLMTEAVSAVAQCGFRKFGLNRIEAWTLEGNLASDRVLKKAGFRYEGTLRQKAWFKNRFHDFRMFGRLSGDDTDTSVGTPELCPRTE